MNSQCRQQFLEWAETEARHMCKTMPYNGENELAVTYATYAAIARGMKQEMGDE